MIKVYVHNSEDWIGERDMDDPCTCDLIFNCALYGRGSWYPFVCLGDWTEIGEL